MSGHHVHTGGHATEVRTLAQRVEAIAERLGDAPLQIAAQYYLAAASYLSGDYRATEHVCRNLMQSLHDQRTREGFGLATFPAVYSRAVLARVLAERGIFDEGDTHGQEAIRIAEALDHPFSVVVGCLDLAYVNDVTHRRLAEVPLVLPAEVRGVIVPDSVAGPRSVEILAEHQPRGLLKPQLLLEPQRTHRRHGPEMSVEP
jgi:hypothetical protein